MVELDVEEWSMHMTDYKPTPPITSAATTLGRLGGAPTYDCHAAQGGDERRGGEAVGREVPKLPDSHEQHAAPPQPGGVVGLQASLRLPHMGVLLHTRRREKRGE